MAVDTQMARIESEADKAGYLCSICSEVMEHPVTLHESPLPFWHGVFDRILDTTACTHSFCRACFEEWMKRDESCPLCRHAVSHVTENSSFNNKISEFFRSQPMGFAEYMRTKKLLQPSIANVRYWLSQGNFSQGCKLIINLSENDKRAALGVLVQSCVAARNSQFLSGLKELTLELKCSALFQIAMSLIQNGQIDEALALSEKIEINESTRNFAPDYRDQIFGSASAKYFSLSQRADARGDINRSLAEKLFSKIVNKEKWGKELARQVFDYYLRKSDFEKAALVINAMATDLIKAAARRDLQTAKKNKMRQRCCSIAKMCVGLFAIITIFSYSVRLFSSMYGRR